MLLGQILIMIRSILPRPRCSTSPWVTAGTVPPGSCSVGMARIESSADDALALCCSVSEVCYLVG
jgi:hypothetical protein